MSEFQKEHRYQVFKLKNLTEDQKQRLYDLRMELGPLNDVGDCVVVEPDWPNYQDTWDDIRAVSEGRFVSRSHLEVQLAEARAEAATWEKRCVAETGALRDMTDQRDALVIAAAATKITEIEVLDSATRIAQAYAGRFNEADRLGSFCASAALKMREKIQQSFQGGKL